LLTDENGNRPLKTRLELSEELQLTGIPVSSEQLDLVLEIMVGSGLVLNVPELLGDRYQIAHDYLVRYIREQGDKNLFKSLEALRENVDFLSGEVSSVKSLIENRSSHIRNLVAQNEHLIHQNRTYAARSPNPLEKGASGVPPFSRGARGDQGFRFQMRKSCRIRTYSTSIISFSSKSPCGM
jgi:hypothetical protein